MESSERLDGNDPVGDAVAQWRQVMPLHRSLPIVFSDGTELARFAVDCAQCRRGLAGDLVRGEVKPQPGDRFALTGLAACAACASFTRFAFMCTGSTGSVQLEWVSGGEVKRHEVHTTWRSKLVAIFR